MTPHTAWKKGQSGNPKGRAKDIDVREARAMCMPYTEEALAVIVDVMRNGRTDGVRMAAAEKIIHRVWGREPEKVELTGRDGNAIEVSESPKERLAHIIARIIAATEEK